MFRHSSPTVSTTPVSSLNWGETQTRETFRRPSCYVRRRYSAWLIGDTMQLISPITRCLVQFWYHFSQNEVQPGITYNSRSRQGHCVQVFTNLGYFSFHMSQTPVLYQRTASDLSLYFQVCISISGNLQERNLALNSSCKEYTRFFFQNTHK